MVGGLKQMLSGIVEEQVEELLNREENRALLDGLDMASQRVETAKRALAEIEKQEIEAKQLRDYVNTLESSTSEVVFFFFSNNCVCIMYVFTFCFSLT